LAKRAISRKAQRMKPKKVEGKKEGKALPPAFEPGVVEVVFDDSAKIRLEKLPPESKKRWNFISKTKADLKSLNEILSRVQATMVGQTFTSSTEEEYDALHKKVKQKQKKEKGPAVPNLNCFFTINVPPTVDPLEVAKELEKLPMVEKAYPVPRAIPPDQIRHLEIAEKKLCSFMSIVGPCRFAQVVHKPCVFSTPLNEPLVGNTDTVYIVDTARNLENQWYIFRCNADSAWTLACGAGVVVADIDWGFLTTHEDLKGGLDMGHAYNSYDGTSNVSAPGDVDHGTAVVGIAGARDNGKGMIGFAFGCTLWPVQANTGTGTPLSGNAWARAIDWVRAQTTTARKVIILEVQTISLHSYEGVPSVNAAIINAIADGVVVCVAAGNGDNDAGIDDFGNPIPFTGSIVVGATAYDPKTNPRATPSNQSIPWASNWGTRVDVAAPGDCDHDLTCSNSADNAYRNGFGGTSGATPKVAGTVAMMLQCDPNLTPGEVRDIIKSTASSTVVTDAGRPIGGFLNAYEAVKKACGKAEPCRYQLVVDQCMLQRIIGECTASRITEVCTKTSIILDPCRLKSIIGDPCVRSRIVIGPCGGSLIAGDPFWRFDQFTNWSEAYENIRNETLKHFKRLTVKT
jgi:hypothetical protein